mmetsp:Transcript_25046/g.80350  ORF Transcript_25046/g.80350 Transcript_25046/m.80350 type:complete len:222 (-) Transcript_25046:90-755(-)
MTARCASTPATRRRRSRSQLMRRAPLGGKRSASSRSTSSRRRSRSHRRPTGPRRVLSASSAPPSRQRCPPRRARSAGTASSRGAGSRTGATRSRRCGAAAAPWSLRSYRWPSSTASQGGCSSLCVLSAPSLPSHRSCRATSTRRCRRRRRSGARPSTSFAPRPSVGPAQEATCPPRTSPSSARSRRGSCGRARSAGRRPGSRGSLACRGVGRYVGGQDRSR